MGNYGFYFDATACVGCRACQLACKEIHDLALGSHFRKVLDCEGGSWSVPGDGAAPVPQGLFGYHISLGCNHCMNPACVEACPSGAMSKDAETGIVSVDQDVCIGCRSCEKACPYHAPSYQEERQVMGKCDLCRDERAHGREPACVAVCAMRALSWGDFSELRQKHPEAVSDAPPLPSSETSPCLLIEPHVGFGAGESQEISFPFELALV